MSAYLLALYGEPVDPAAFAAYYEAHHVAIARSIPGLESFQISDGPALAPDGSGGFHRVAVLRFASLADVQAGLASPEGQATAGDLGKFASGGVTLVVFEARDVTSA